ncbi:M48 family metallopeptidase [Sphingobium indicum]|nr:M48 family metallopeptidase [Sphingobium indicum]
MRRLVAQLATGLACLLAQAAAAAPALPPPYAGAYQPQGVDEIGLWREMDEDEQRLAVSSLVIRDEKLTRYLTKILCDTVGADRCNSARIYVMREPTFNATMAPNGTMRIFSGLLLRVHNEAELGAILGHEFGHFESRHSLEKFRSGRQGTDLLAWAAVLASLAPSYDVRRPYQDLQLSVYGNLFRFGRDQEREADALGIGYLNKSQFPPQAASLVWQNVMAEIEASAQVRGLKKPNFERIAFTASHPPHGERAATMATLALPDAAARDAGADRYRAALAPWLPLFLEDQVKLNDFGASDYLIQSLAQSGWTAPLWFARGELYRSRGAQRDLVNAAEFYAQAIASDGSMADAYRGLGLSLVKTGRRSEGAQALRTYLEKKPDASDASMILMMLPKEGTGN